MMFIADKTCPRKTLILTLLAWLASFFASQTQAIAQTKPLIEWHAKSDTAVINQPAKLRVDRGIVPAAHAEVLSDSQRKAASVAPNPTPHLESRRLAPPSRKKPLIGLAQQDNDRGLSLAEPQMESLTTAGAGLAIVVGLFLLCSWFFRRTGPKATSPLPKDAVAVLGRVPLAGNHFAHLIKLGSRLILVAVGPDNVTTLAEVSEPSEVQNLLSLCMQNHSQSTSAEFQQVLQQLAKEPASGFLEKNTAAAAYARSGRT